MFNPPSLNVKVVAVTLWNHNSPKVNFYKVGVVALVNKPVKVKH